MKKNYNQPKTETFDLKGEGLMQGGVLAPVSSGGDSSQNQGLIYDGD